MAHLSGFGLENFRVFKEYTWFDFAPITILVGPNNSGKSTLLKALLLLKDNYRKKYIPFDFIGDYFENRPALTFDGKKHDLQSNMDILHTERKDDNLLFRLPYNSRDSIFKDNSLYFSFSYKLKDDTLYPSVVFSITNSEDKVLLSLDPYKGYYINLSLLYGVIKKETDFSEWRFKNLKMEVTEIQGIGYVEKYDLWSYLLEQLPLLTQEPCVLQKFDPLHDDFFGSLIESCRISNANDPKKLAYFINYAMNLGSFSYAFAEISGLYHFSPRGRVPKRYFTGEEQDSITEALMSVKEPYSKIVTGYIHAFISDSGISINDFMRKWEKLFLIPGELSWKKNSELGYIQFNVGDKYLNDIGYGISQLASIILGVVIKAYELRDTAYGSGSLMLVEEPETNLHPGLQSKLGDFFLDSVKSFNHQFIIETHSEYLIRKLQYLIAKGEAKPEDVAIYYFHDPNNIPKGEKQVKKITILEDGSLSDDFGPGFFDEAANLALSLFDVRKNRQN